MQNRRVAIQQLLLIWSGVAFLPSCLNSEQKVSIPLKLIHIDPNEEILLSELAETILPKTDTPGAKELSAHLFVLKMVDDCMPKADQEKYLKGMKEFESYVEKKTGKTFVENDVTGRNAIVAELDQRKSTESAMEFFFRNTKSLTVEAYRTCEYYLTKIRGYKMLPGKFQGCVPVKNA
jgi:Gluconate 2-dehydrogenase subunit 3